MKCPTCRKENNAFALFCDECGQVFAVKDTAPETLPERKHNRERARCLMSPMNEAVAATCLLLLLLLVILVFFLTVPVTIFCY